MPNGTIAEEDAQPFHVVDLEKPLEFADHQAGIGLASRRRPLRAEAGAFVRAASSTPLTERPAAVLAPPSQLSVRG